MLEALDSGNCLVTNSAHFVVSCIAGSLDNRDEHVGLEQQSWLSSRVSSPSSQIINCNQSEQSDKQVQKIQMSGTSQTRQDSTLQP